MSEGEKIVNFESMFQNVTDTVKDMGDLKEIIEKEIKNLRSDLYTIIKSYDLRITELERKISIWENVKFISVGGIVGILLTIIILSVMGSM